jgi:hypothetical protein
MNFKQSLTSQNGQVAYVSFMQNGINTINLYNLTTPTISLISTFNNNGASINPDRLCLTDQYLISFSPYDLNLHYFSLINRNLIGTFSLG